MTNERTVEERVRELLFTFGKLGLLIEDAPDAQLRTARELYGTDGLPLWWLRFDILDEGTTALQAAWQAVSRGEPEWAKGLPLLVILDRYLKESAASPRAVAWDDDEDRPIVGIVREILDADKKLPVHLEAVTSYSGPSHTSGLKIVPWRLRHHEPLYQLRRRLEEGTPARPTGLRPLLSFGPVKTPPVISHSGQEGIVTDEEKKVALCRAKHWQVSINALAEALDSTDPKIACVLLTGAGASLANDPLAPGIPDTWYLLERACWEVTGRPNDRRLAWPPPGRATIAKPPPPEPPPPEKIRSLQRLRERYEEGVSIRDLDWSLETLFDHKIQDPGTLKELASAFRQALQLWDHDFPYQSWLLPQLPWTLILTTNFDGFHERAAANAAALSSPAAVDGVRRLGDVIPLPETQDDSPKVWPLEELVKGPGLLKPYGGLMTTGALALTHRDFWPRLKPVSQGFLKPMLETCTECWIAIVGQRLTSDALQSVFTDLLNDSTHGKKIRILWVEPFPYRNDLDQFECSRRFRDVLDGVTLQPFAERPVTCPLPARALDFAVDLWAEWHRIRRQD